MAHKVNLNESESVYLKYICGFPAVRTIYKELNNAIFGEYSLPHVITVYLTVSFHIFSRVPPFGLSKQCLSFGNVLTFLKS